MYFVLNRRLTMGSLKHRNHITSSQWSFIQYALNSFLLVDTCLTCISPCNVLYITNAFCQIIRCFTVPQTNYQWLWKRYKLSLKMQAIPQQGRQTGRGFFWKGHWGLRKMRHSRNWLQLFLELAFLIRKVTSSAILVKKAFKITWGHCRACSTNFHEWHQRAPMLLHKESPRFHIL